VTSDIQLGRGLVGQLGWLRDEKLRRAKATLEKTVVHQVIKRRGERPVLRQGVYAEPTNQQQNF